MCVCVGGGGREGGVSLLQISHKYMYVMSPLIYNHAHGSQGIAATSFHYSKPHLSDLPKK